MSTSTTNLFAFDRALPAPFDTLKSKKISVTSTYGDGTISTLCASVIKAVHAVCRCMSGTGEGAVGVIDHRTVAEYKSSAGPDAYHLVVYDSNSGSRRMDKESVYMKFTFPKKLGLELTKALFEDECDKILSFLKTRNQETIWE